MKRKLKVMLLAHPQMRPDVLKPRGATERDVWKTLRDLGHTVEVTALNDGLEPLDRELARFKPDIAFNLLEEFRDEGIFDFHPVSYLEARGIAYTGCNPRGLIVSRHKEWAVRIARGENVLTPDTREGSSRFPAFVKYVREHASRGLTSQNKVESKAELRRVRSAMARKFPGQMVVQEFVRGTDVSVSVYGNSKVVVLPPWKLNLGNANSFATERIKFSAKARRLRGVRAYRYSGPAKTQLISSARKLYAAFDLSGYARMDFRVSEGGQAYFIDVNANPNLARDEDFARAAKVEGLAYPELIDKILKLGLDYQPRI